jgi:acyl-CoA thioesterase
VSSIEDVLANDRLFRLFGMELEEAREGYARVSATVGDLCLNTHDIAHGGFIFSLADVAFAVAVNSVTPAVGVQWSLNMFRAALPGERVVAECGLIHKGRSMLVVDFAVRNGDGRLLAQGQATALPAKKERFVKERDAD